MIVVLINREEDTDTRILRKVYQGLDDIRLMVNPTKGELEDVLRANRTETLLAMGHGTCCGLLNKDFSGYVLSDAELLRDRDVIAIWCHASDFAELTLADEGIRLHGFFSSMFISNENEASCFGYEAQNQDIYKEVELFSERVNKLLKDKTPLNEWVNILRSQADMTKDYVRFNYDGLRYY